LGFSERSIFHRLKKAANGRQPLKAINYRHAFIAKRRSVSRFRPMLAGFIE
jgi:hypothetical protein